MPATGLLSSEIATGIVATVDFTLGGLAVVVSVWLALTRRTRRSADGNTTKAPLGGAGQPPKA